MGLFVRRKVGVLDFTKRYPQEKENPPEIKGGIFSEGISGSFGQVGSAEKNDSENVSVFGGSFGIFGDASPSADLISQNSYENSSGLSSEDAEERKRRFAKRIANMTDKLEELSNQLYHIQQRLEVVERKLNYSRDIQ